ncbi:hypothetical protein ACFYQA_07895 [Streptomyces sp. NPDC005774]|uniref:hypothetical protein n=1 Tax=Streptomyces sp. NPDC005774 TaxID=3364728 RepID=UPI0036B0B531
MTTVAEAGDGQGVLDVVSDDGIVLDASGDVARPSGQAAYAPGAQVRIRDEQWLVKKVSPTARDGWMVEVTGVSAFVRGTDAVFCSHLDEITVLDPRKTTLVPDDSSNHPRARLYLEAMDSAQSAGETARPQD